MIWFLTWAVLFVVVIYSPIGSPELYTQNDYDGYYPPVNFSTGIANAPTMHTIQQYEETDLGIPVYTPEQKTYTVNTPVQSRRDNHHTNYAVEAPINNRTTSNQSIGGGGGGSTFMSSGNKSAQGKSTPVIGASSFSTDLALAEDPSTTRQLAGNAVLDGGTDPGGDPTGPPIPVGDGFWILVLMAIGYVIKLRIAKIRITRLNTNYTN